MRLIVTRPLDDARPLCARLTVAGHSVILAPLLNIRPVADLRIPERDYQAVVITSANGARALAGRRELDRLKSAMALAVGPASAAAARSVGFARIEEAEGDLDALVRKTTGLLRPDGGPLLYVSGAVTAGDLARRLEPSGFKLDRVIAYEARPIEVLPQPCAEAMTAGEADAVLLYSPRTARVWAALVAAAALVPQAGRLVHFCLSGNVAGAVHDGLGTDVAVQVAPRPDEAALLEMIPQPA